MGGRITLIKFILSNLPLYYLSVFSIPTKVAKKLEQIQRIFLWEGNRTKKYHIIKWSEVTLPKSMGDLGIGNIVLKNTLLGKWIWRFIKEENSLWHFIILCKYRTGPNGWDSNPTPSPQTLAIWKRILDTHPLVYSHLSLVIGDGCQVQFLSDTWIGDCPLAIRFPHLFRLASNKTASISDIHSNSINGLT